MANIEHVISAARAVADNARPTATSIYNSFEDARAAAAVVEAFELFANTLNAWKKEEPE